MKAEILKVLRESRGHVSGQELCERFQVSRTAIWKVISQLKEEGYEIEAVRNKGYRLKRARMCFLKKRWKAGLRQDNWKVCRILCRDRLYEYSCKAGSRAGSCAWNTFCGRQAECRKRTQRKKLGFPKRN